MASYAQKMCPECEGEGTLDRCDGACYIEANKVCNGMEDGVCKDGYLVCDKCHGKGYTLERNRGKKHMKLSELVSMYIKNITYIRDRSDEDILKGAVHIALKYRDELPEHSDYKSKIISAIATYFKHSSNDTFYGESEKSSYKHWNKLFKKLYDDQVFQTLIINSPIAFTKSYLASDRYKKLSKMCEKAIDSSWVDYKTSNNTTVEQEYQGAPIYSYIHHLTGVFTEMYEKSKASASDYVVLKEFVIQVVGTPRKSNIKGSTLLVAVAKAFEDNSARSKVAYWEKQLERMALNNIIKPVYADGFIELSDRKSNIGLGTSCDNKGTPCTDDIHVSAHTIWVDEASGVDRSVINSLPEYNVPKYIVDELFTSRMAVHVTCPKCLNSFAITEGEFSAECPNCKEVFKLIVAKNSVEIPVDLLNMKVRTKYNLDKGLKVANDKSEVKTTYKGGKEFHIALNEERIIKL